MTFKPEQSQNLSETEAERPEAVQDLIDEFERVSPGDSPNEIVIATPEYESIHGRTTAKYKWDTESERFVSLDSEGVMDRTLSSMRSQVDMLGPLEQE